MSEENSNNITIFTNNNKADMQPDHLSLYRPILPPIKQQIEGLSQLNTQPGAPTNSNLNNRVPQQYASMQLTPIASPVASRRPSNPVMQHSQVASGSPTSQQTVMAVNTPTAPVVADSSSHTGMYRRASAVTPTSAGLPWTPQQQQPPQQPIFQSLPVQYTQQVVATPTGTQVFYSPSTSSTAPMTTSIPVMSVAHTTSQGTFVYPVAEASPQRASPPTHHGYPQGVPMQAATSTATYTMIPANAMKRSFHDAAISHLNTPPQQRKKPKRVPTMPPVTGHTGSGPYVMGGMPLVSPPASTPGAPDSYMPHHYQLHQHNSINNQVEDDEDPYSDEDLSNPSMASTPQAQPSRTPSGIMHVPLHTNSTTTTNNTGLGPEAAKQAAAAVVASATLLAAPPVSATMDAEGDPALKRAQQNREAQRSFRLRRKLYVRNLEDQARMLVKRENEVADLKARCAGLEEQVQALQAELASLRK